REFHACGFDPGTVKLHANLRVGVWNALERNENFHAPQTLDRLLTSRCRSGRLVSRPSRFSGRAEARGSRWCISAVTRVSTNHFKNPRPTHPAADTHRDQAVASVAAPEFAENGDSELRAGGAERMSQRDGSSV